MKWLAKKVLAASVLLSVRTEKTLHVKGTADAGDEPQQHRCLLVYARVFHEKSRIRSGKSVYAAVVPEQVLCKLFRFSAAGV